MMKAKIMAHPTVSIPSTMKLGSVRLRSDRLVVLQPSPAGNAVGSIELQNGESEKTSEGVLQLAPENAKMSGEKSGNPDFSSFVTYADLGSRVQNRRS